MKTTQPKQWIEFKEKFYKQFPEEDPKLLDYIAVYGILYLIVNGISNEDIAEILNENQEYIESVCDEFLGFLGYKETLDFSPIKQYIRFKTFTERFKGESSSLFDTFLEIERKVNEYYGRN
jgi:hypothetical protein